MQIAKKSQVSALELTLSISCGWYSNLCLHCQAFFAFRRFSLILSCLPQIEILKSIFELYDFLNSPVKWKVLSTVKPVFNETRKLAPSSDRAIILKNQFWARSHRCNWILYEKTHPRELEYHIYKDAFCLRKKRLFGPLIRFISWYLKRNF